MSSLIFTLSEVEPIRGFGAEKYMIFFFLFLNMIILALTYRVG